MKIATKFLTAAGFIGALVLSPAGFAYDGSLTMSNYAYPSALGFSITGHSSVGAGGFSASYDKNFAAAPAATSFVSYCIDLAQTFSWNTPINNIVERTPLSLFGAFKAGALDRLYTQHFAASTTPTLSAAFQLSVWEIVTETTASTYATLGLTTGTFVATAGDSTARTTADTWLHNLGAGNSGGYTLTALTTATNQDQMMATPVPEPQTYVMLLAGLGLMGFVARRRQRAMLTPA